MEEILTKAGCYIAIILLGMALRRIGFFKGSDFTILSKIVINITLPASVLINIAGKSVEPGMLAVAALGLGCGLIQIGTAWLMNLRNDRERRAFEMLNLPGYNVGVFAIPFVGGFLGSTGVLTCSVFDLGNALVTLGGAYGVAAAVKDGAGFDGKRIVKALSRSVPFLTYLAVAFMNLFHIPVPGPILSCAGIIGNSNAFLAMLMIGVGFQLELDRTKLGRAIRLLIARYGLATAMGLVFYFLLPFDMEVRRALVMLSFAPIGSAIPGFTAELKSDVGLSCTINSLSIICSIVIMVALLLLM